MTDTFHDLYSELLNGIFIERAREQLAQGVDGMACADAYADQGKPDFALAHLLLAEASDEIKRNILAHAYERRAELTDRRAEDFSNRFHRPFPLVKLEAQKDRMSAEQVRHGKHIRRGSKSLHIN
ncbi:MAG TPA: hypothetical protein VL461_07240 [Dictyobacter sp.]|jgi:hypothetical protein|nr:hypothetical protein [Dictyobacter sp.]